MKRNYTLSCCQFKSLNSILDVIRDMGSNEQVHIDGYLGNVVLEITKDLDYNRNRHTIVMDMHGEDVMNFVTVDFQLNGKSIASTCDIHVNELEDALNDIKDGDTSYLIDETKPLSKLVEEYTGKTEKRHAKSKDNFGRD